MDRWWDSPDVAGNLALVDDSDPQMGVATAVLGFHALTKAGLVKLETQTLVDRQQLEGVFDDVDLQPVSKAVARATSGALGPVAAARYADVVVDDWRARGKVATGRLTTTLVAKGLPWPRAVARAASVAGVPLERLGRYATTAAAPGLDLVSAADMADRVLMEYARYRGAMEPFPSVEVSKERERLRHRQEEPVNPEFEQKVNRDSLGQFARESSSQKEQEERKAKRMARRARRENRQPEGPKTAQTEQPTEQQGMVRNAAQRGVTRNVARNRVVQRNVQRNSTSQQLDVMDARDVPPVGSLAEPVLVNEPLYLVLTQMPPLEGSAHRGWVVEDMAFRRSEAKRLAGNIHRHPTLKVNVVLLELAPWSQAVVGTKMYDAAGTRRGFDQFNGKGFVLAGHEQGWMVERRHLGPVSESFDVANKPQQDDIEVLGTDISLPIKLQVFAATVKKADEGRERIRHRKREVQNPEFEQEVKRDALGQFAVEGEDTAEAQQQRAERRAKRQERRARREQRAQRQVSTAQEAEAPKEAEQAVARNTQRDRKVVRNARKERGVVRNAQRQAETPPQTSNDIWEAFVMSAMENSHASARAIGGATLSGIGFSSWDLANEKPHQLPSYFMSLDNGHFVSLASVLHDDGEQNGPSKMTQRQIKDRYRHLGADQRVGKDGQRIPRGIEVRHVYEPPSELELQYINSAHNLAGALAKGIRGVDVQAVRLESSFHADPRYVAQTVLQRAVDESALNYAALERQVGTQPIALGEGIKIGHEDDAWSEVENYEGEYQLPSTSRVMVAHAIGGGVRLVSSNTRKPGGGDPKDHVYLAMVHPAVADVMQLIYDATLPGNDDAVYAKRNVAAYELMRRYDPTKSKPLKGLIEAALTVEDIRVEQLDQPTKVDVLLGAMPNKRHRAVRLDNIDLLRFV